MVSQNKMLPEIFTVIAEVKYANGPMQPAQTHAHMHNVTDACISRRE
jgi:hypothetical protein